MNFLLQKRTGHGDNLCEDVRGAVLITPAIPNIWQADSLLHMAMPLQVSVKLHYTAMYKLSIVRPGSELKTPPKICNCPKSKKIQCPLQQHRTSFTHLPWHKKSFIGPLFAHPSHTLLIDAILRGKCILNFLTYFKFEVILIS